MKPWNGYQNGINLGGWLSQCVHTKEHYDTFISEKDVARIADDGLDHVRLPIDYNLLQDEEGRLKEENFSYIDRCVDACRRYGVNLILDLHKTAGYSFDKGENESGLFFTDEALIQQFLTLWEELAKRYGSLDPHVAFELLNEVVEPESNAPWMKIAERAVKVIRRYAPTVKILIGSYWNNSVLTVKHIAAPFDENIVYSFHCYEPLLFTHQNAHWMEEMKGFFVSYPMTRAEFEEKSRPFGEVYHLTDWAIPASGFNIDYYETLFAEAIAVAEERNVSLYCGEYGVIDQADPVSREAWLKDVRAVLARHGIGSAVWSYKKMDFGVYEL